MSENINHSSFPKSKSEALTMMYLQNQDLTGLSPVELAKKFDEVYKLIDGYYDGLLNELAANMIENM